MAEAAEELHPPAALSKAANEVVVEVEEAQGGAAVGATKEAVAAAAKARGGTNGWGGNRTSCWSC